MGELEGNLQVQIFPRPG